MAGHYLTSERQPMMQVDAQVPGGKPRDNHVNVVFQTSFHHKHTFVHTPTSSSSAPATPTGVSSRRNEVASDHPSQHRFLSRNVTIEEMKTGLENGSTIPNKREYTFLNANLPTLKRHRTDEIISSRKIRRRLTEPLSLTNDVNIDIWQNILSFCEPNFLLDAQLLNSGFRRILSDRHAIWKRSRRHHFGYDMPDCPKGITEPQYADLLVGRGCQNKTCPKQHTAKVYWTFLGRLCTNCLSKKTMREDDLPRDRRHYLSNSTDSDENTSSNGLWNLLPMASMIGGRYLHPRRVYPTQKQWASEKGHYFFMKSSYAKLEFEYLSLLHDGADPDKISSWWRRKYDANMQYMIQVASIHSWDKDRCSQTKDLRSIRIKFFQNKLAELEPPWNSALLERMAAYQKAIGGCRLPTERMWENLKHKIIPHKAQAEMLISYHEQTIYSRGPLIQLFRRLHNHRSVRREERKYFRPEQLFVIELGRREFARCIDDSIADADLVLLFLKNVWESFQQSSNRPMGLNHDGTTGPYQLSMDDARMLLEEIVEGKIPRLSQRGGQVFQCLKCAGCSRSDYTKLWSFQECLEHIAQTHAQVVGEGSEFWRFATPYPQDYEHENRSFRFPWYTVPWPRCLPFLAAHQEMAEAGRWSPDADIPYRQLQPRPSRSAFMDRIACDDGLEILDFRGHLIYAAKMLNGVRLSSQCQTKIILRYAFDHHQRAQVDPPTFESFILAIPFLQEANPTLDFRFRCGLCIQEGRVNRRSRQVKFNISMDLLRAHWEAKHPGYKSDWFQNLINLPSDSEVYDLIVDSDQRLYEEQKAIRVKMSKRSSNGKKSCLKGSVVLGAEFAMERFSRLFLPESNHSCVAAEV